MPSFPKPPDVPEYVDTTIAKPVSYKPTAVIGDGSNTWGGISPAVANELIDPNPGQIAAYFDTFNGNFDSTNGFKDLAGGATEAKFRSHANVTHFAREDPIRNYGMPDSAHWHMFFGNRFTNAYSTYATLRKNPQSNAAGGIMNGTGYWAPAMLVTINGQTYAKVANNIVIYYTTFQGNNKISLLPQGLRYVAGFNMDDPLRLAEQAEIDASNAAIGANRYRLAGSGFNGYKMLYNGQYQLTDQGKIHSQWLVNPDGSDPWEGRAAGGYCLAEINAPKYHDGTNLWSPGGYKHFRTGAVDTYDQDRVKGPDGWWEVPQLQLIFEFSHNGWDDYKRWSLSSDPMASAARIAQGGTAVNPGQSFHIDWLGAWETTTFKTWQRNGPGAEGNVGHEMGDSIISSSKKLLVGGQAPDGRFPQVKLSNEFITDPQYMVALPSGSGSGPITITHKGN